MKRSFLALLLLVCILPPIFSDPNNSWAEEREKSVFVGTALGALGLVGWLIPGTYGWGNYYVGDRVGFWILNIGGSICTALTYIDIFYINPYPSEDISAFAIIGMLGSFYFGGASLVWGGGCSARIHNLKLEKQKLSYFILPGENGISLNVIYKL